MRIVVHVVLWSCIGLAQVAGGMLNAGELVGRVVDATGGPLHTTTVELRLQGAPAVVGTFLTDNSGGFRFKELAAGIYELSFSCPGFRSAKITRTVSTDENISLPDVVLEVAPIGHCPDPDWGPPEILSTPDEEGTEITGRVAERDYKPIREAVVMLTDGSGSYRTLSGPTGAFWFSDVKPGVYRLQVQQTGFAEFVVNKVEIKEKHSTEISDQLLLQPCPARKKCQAVQDTLRVRICL